MALDDDAIARVTTTSACTASELRQRIRALCLRVVEAAGAQPVHTGYVEVLRASLAQAPAGQLGDALSRPLCDLAASLLSDLPFRFVREAVALLHAAALGAAAAAQSALLAHAACAGFFAQALQHANREVRHTSLELLGLLAPEVSGVSNGAIDEVVRGCALPRLCELIEMGQGRDGPAVAEVLRALCRNAAGAAACRKAGLSARLCALSPRARQGAAGQAVSEVLLRMGFLGGTSELGGWLSALAPREAASGVVAETPPLFADAAMAWPDGRRVWLHRALLAARCPRWGRLIETGELCAALGGQDPTREMHPDVAFVRGEARGEARGGGGTEAAARGGARTAGGERRIPARAACEIRVPGCGGPVEEAGVHVCWLCPRAAAELAPEAVALLYRLVACGGAEFEFELGGASAALLGGLARAAARLGMRELLLAPPCDAAGHATLGADLAMLAWADAEGGCVGRPGGGVAGGGVACGGLHADIVFELSDGPLAAHRCLLAATSEYFCRMLAWNAAAAPRCTARVAVGGACCSAFRALLLFLYSGSVNTVPRAAAGSGDATAGGEPPLATRAKRLTLGATDAYELSSLATRYMLPALAAEARGMMRDALTPAEVAPLLCRAQAECEADALQMVFGWAVEHFEEVTHGICV